MSWNKSQLWWTISRFSWLDKKNKKQTINSIHKKYNKCVQYVEAAALSHEKKEKNHGRTTKIKKFYK